MRHLLFIILASASVICQSQPAQKISFRIAGGIDNASLKKTMETNTATLLSNLNEAYKYNEPRPLIDRNIITENGLKAINELWSLDHFYCHVVDLSEVVVRKDDRFQVRNIPIVINRKDTAEIVIGYLGGGRIDDVYLGLNNTQYTRVLSANSVIDETRREIILNFIENFRNYYIKKDIENISRLYRDKALIIIGKVLKPVETPVDRIKSNLSEKQISYMVLAKEQYISRLKTVFNNSKYIFLNFDSIQVVKHRKHPEFYGVLLQQSWTTPGYSDKGWLFLLMQFKEDEEPLIWVRTWQDVVNTSFDNVFGMHNFILRPDDRKASIN